MSVFHKVLSELCVQSGSCYIHVDCAPEAPSNLKAIIGDLNFQHLEEGEEVQFLVSPIPMTDEDDAEKLATRKYSQIVNAFMRAKTPNANVVLITNNGVVKNWTSSINPEED